MTDLTFHEWHTYTPESAPTLAGRDLGDAAAPLNTDLLRQVQCQDDRLTAAYRPALAIILYPTLNPAAQEACIEVRDPLAGGRRAEVILRPVDMSRLERLAVGPHTAQQARDAVAYAHWLAGANPG